MSKMSKSLSDETPTSTLGPRQTVQVGLHSGPQEAGTLALAWHGGGLHKKEYTSPVSALDSCIPGVQHK